MRDSYYALGINERATTIVVKPVLPLEPWESGRIPPFAPEFYLDELDARGMDYVCRMLGQMALGLLRIQHRDPMDRYDIYPAPAVGAQRFVDPDSNVTRLPPSDYNGVMRPRHVAVGLSDSALAINVAEHDGSGAMGIGWYVALAELQALGPAAASKTVGERILRTLICQHPDAFAPFPTLSHQPRNEA